MSHAQCVHFFLNCHIICQFNIQNHNVGNIGHAWPGRGSWSTYDSRAVWFVSGSPGVSSSRRLHQPISVTMHRTVPSSPAEPGWIIFTLAFFTQSVLFLLYFVLIVEHSFVTCLNWIQRFAVSIHRSDLLAKMEEGVRVLAEMIPSGFVEQEELLDDALAVVCGDLCQIMELGIKDPSVGLPRGLHGWR